MLKYDFPDVFDLIVDPSSLVAANFTVCGREIVWNPTLRRNLYDWKILRVIEFLACL